jgi:hypothetical protein
MTDVDDDDLSTLFRTAASDPGAPPPGFDHRSVVAASRRVTVRRRAAVTGVGVALFAAVGVGGMIVLPANQQGGAGEASTAAAPMIESGPEVPLQAPAPGADARAAAPENNNAPPPAAPGAPAQAAAPDAPAAGAAPLGPGTAECADRQDPALRALVEQVLPEVVGAPEAATTMECRPAGERGVNVEVRDGAATGLLTVQYLPPGAAVQAPDGALTAPTASGGTVVVASRPDRPNGTAPLTDRLEQAITYLAPRL